MPRPVGDDGFAAGPTTPVFEPFQIGRYECTEQLGAGRFSTVYKAKHQGFAGFEKSYALKVMHERVTEDFTFVSAFVQEANVSAQLNHGNIVRVLECGLEGGKYFLALEYIDGMSLRQLLNHLHATGRTVPWELAAFITLAVADALDYGHRFTDQRGFPLPQVHGELNPSNIMLRWEGGVKVRDFGLRRALQQARHTLPDRRPTHFCYLAPETIDAGELDGRSDLFTLGAVLLEMLSGRPAYLGRTLNETLDRVRTAGLPQDSNVNPVLEPILWKLLAWDPAARFDSASSLHNAVSRLLAEHGQRISTVPMAEYLKDIFDEIRIGHQQQQQSLLTPCNQVEGSHRQAETVRLKRPDDLLFEEDLSEVLQEGRMAQRGGRRGRGRKSTPDFTEWEETGVRGAVSEVLPAVYRDHTGNWRSLTTSELLLERPVTEKPGTVGSAAELAEDEELTRGYGRSRAPRDLTREESSPNAELLLPPRDFADWEQTVDQQGDAPRPIPSEDRADFESVRDDPARARFIEPPVPTEPDLTNPELTRPDITDSDLDLDAHDGSGEQAVDAPPATVEAALRQFLNDRPHDASLLTRLSAVLMVQGRVDEAVSELQRATSSRPRYAPAWRKLGLALLVLRRYPEARSALERAVTEGAGDVRVRTGLAVALMREGALKEAASELETVIHHHPRHGRAYLLLAICCKGRGQQEQAKAYARRAEQLGENIQILPLRS
ncbi:MAG: protein kinase [bacterium]